MYSYRFNQMIQEIPATMPYLTQCLKSPVFLTALALFIISACGIFDPTESDQPSGKIYGQGVALSVDETSDGGYILMGNKYLSTTSTLLIKVDQHGEKVWEKETSIFSAQPAQYIRRGTDNGFIMVGWGMDPSSVHLAKTDPEGELQWEKDVPGIASAYVLPSQDGGSVLVGHAGHEDSSDVILVKVNAHGEEVWRHTLSVSNESRAHAYGAARCDDGGYIITGTVFRYIHDDGSNNSSFLVKTDTDGNEEWRQAPGSSYMTAYSVDQTSDSGYVIIGTTPQYLSPDGSPDDLVIVKTDASGQTQWNVTVTESDFTHYPTIHEAAEGGYFILGTTYLDPLKGFDALVIKTDSTGNKQWEQTYGGTLADNVHDSILCSSGDLVISGSLGQYQSNKPFYFIWLLKTDPDGHSEW